MVRNKGVCKMCKRKMNKRNLIKVGGYGMLCYKCRQTIPEYKEGYQLPTNKTLAWVYGLKNKFFGDNTK